MKIRNKILIYFSATVIALTAIAFVFIYFLFSEYREEEFQQRQKEKIKYTIGLISEYKDLSENLSSIMDKHTIHDFYDEKMLIFDKHKTKIYSSIDDLPITNAQEILHQLSPSKQWLEMKDDKYDIIGVYIENENSHFYAISKAYDAFGYTKMFFLGNVLIGIFVIIVFVVIFVSQLLSKKISEPITVLANSLNNYKPNDNATNNLLSIKSSTYEIQQLAAKFNDLLKRTNEAFAFQKHTIHHVSHQLKTPIAVLVSELERIHNYNTIEEIKPEIQAQIIKAKSLGGIINVLLEISKIESGQEITKVQIRTDELIFDIITSLSIIYPEFEFEVNYYPNIFNEDKLMINANPLMIRQAFQNLLTNCIAYSNNNKAEIKLDCTLDNELKISFINQGETISLEEEKFLFKHFFRGQNSRTKIGFGLGLVLTKKIIELNDATISYNSTSGTENMFEIRFPLS